MKYGMNLLLWTAGVTEEHFPLLAQIRQWGFDGVELPLFAADEATLKRVRQELDNQGLGRTAVCICPPGANPIPAAPSGRRAAVGPLQERIGWCALVGGEILCGPFPPALGAPQGRGRTEDEWKWC